MDPFGRRTELVLLLLRGRSGLRLIAVVPVDVVFWLPIVEDMPLGLRFGSLLWPLRRSELASWLADETLLERAIPGAASQVSLRPSSHGATELAMSSFADVACRMSLLINRTYSMATQGSVARRVLTDRNVGG